VGLAMPGLPEGVKNRKVIHFTQCFRNYASTPKFLVGVDKSTLMYCEKISF